MAYKSAETLRDSPRPFNLEAALKTLPTTGAFLPKAKCTATLHLDQTNQSRFNPICTGLPGQLAATLHRTSHSLGSATLLARHPGHGDYMQTRWLSADEIAVKRKGLRD
jgi:hypothetical protein